LLGRLIDDPALEFERRRADNEKSQGQPCDQRLMTPSHQPDEAE
jgi:hypothetical protein